MPKALNTSPALRPSYGDKLASEFKILAEAYSDFGRAASVEMVPFDDTSLPHFSKLTFDQKTTALQSLRNCVDICAITERNGGSVSDPRALTWSSMKVFGFRPPSNLFTFITSDHDVMEMHSKDGLQIFRSFRFFSLCSYTIEELASFHWSLLYGRDDDTVNPEIALLMQRIFSGTEQAPFPSGVRPHNVYELMSKKRYAIRLDIRHAAPLFREGSSVPGASIVIETADFAASSVTTTAPSELAAKLPVPFELSLERSNAESGPYFPSVAK